MSYGGENSHIGPNIIVGFLSYQPYFSESFVVVDVLSAALDSGTALGVILVFFWSVFQL
jgi:hypothetical protein